MSTRRILDLVRSSSKGLYSEITYVDPSALVKAYTNRVRSNTTGSVQSTLGSYSYTYDELNNIKTISENGVLRVTYHYDEQNQLIREDNNYDGMRKSIVYIYDEGGNLLENKYYPYTTGSLYGTPVVTAYEYDSQWKDKLIKYNGQDITYDEIGNLLSYKGNTLTWIDGRTLGSVRNDTTGMTSTYTVECQII